jgi:hypothetical protein
MSKQKIAFLPDAKRRCQCGLDFAIHKACHRRFPIYSEIPVFECDDCGHLVEYPLEPPDDPVQLELEDGFPDDTEPMFVRYKKRRPKRTLPENVKALHSQVCAECGRPQSSDAMQHLYIELRDADGSYWEWWCHNCVRAFDDLQEEIYRIAESHPFIP